MYRYQAKIWDSYAEAYLSDFPPNFNIIAIRPSFVDLHLRQSGPNAAGGNGVIPGYGTVEFTVTGSAKRSNQYTYVNLDSYPGSLGYWYRVLGSYLFTTRL